MLFWACGPNQGVLLLNSTLTVENGKANSHKDTGWSSFTDTVIKEISKDLDDTLNEISPNVYLIKHNPNNGQLQRCKIYLKMCEDYYFSKDNLLDLIEGELVIDKKIYQYLGKSLDFKIINATMEN